MIAQSKRGRVRDYELPWMRGFGEWPKSKRVLVTLATEGVVLVVVLTGLFLFASDKAHAACSPATSPDTTCPSPAAFEKKYVDGFFVKADGVPMDTIFNAPGQVKDFWTDRWVDYYLNHKGQQGALAQHANKVAQTAPRTGGQSRVPGCTQIPFTPSCMAQLELWDMIHHTHCGTWYKFPNLNDKASCNAFRFTGTGEDPITIDDVKRGFHIVACVAGTGAAIYTAVEGGGKAAAFFASLAGTDCALTLWEAAQN